MVAQGQQLFDAFGRLFEYPTPHLLSDARDCASLLPEHETRAALVASFASFLEGTSPEHLQEIYTRTFDLKPSCFPYVGYHVFGESYKRGDFLARLRGRYRELGLDPGSELPDHLAVVLRFISLLGDDQEGRDFVELCLAPAVVKMLESLRSEENPYGWVLQALAQSIGPPPKEGVPGG